MNQSVELSPSNEKLIEFYNRQVYSRFVQHVEMARKGRLKGTREERDSTIYQSDVFLGLASKEMG